MHDYIVKTGHETGYIEVDRAFDGAIRESRYEFNGYVVLSQGTTFWPFPVTPVTDPQAPADFVTDTGGRYNRVVH